MEEVREAVRALASGAYQFVRSKDETKYGPLAFQEQEFKQLVERGNYGDVIAGDLSEGKYGEIDKRDGEKCLIFDTSNIPDKVLIENSDLFKALHKRCDGFALVHRRGISKVMNEEGNIVDRVFNRFRGQIPRRFLPVLEEALVLRALDQKKNLHWQTVYQWRGEIASNYSENGHDPDEAYNLISLCSTGYLDEGRFFDNLYTDLVEDGSKTDEEYKQLFKRYVSNNPFAVFVKSRGRDTEDICDEIEKKLGRIHRWEGSPGFVDLCGKGENAQGVIRDVREELEPEFEGEVVQKEKPEIEQLVIQFRPSIQQHVRNY